MTRPARIVMVTADVADKLDREPQMKQLRMRFRGRDRDVSRVLADLREAATEHRISASGNGLEPTPEQQQELTWLSTTGAGLLLGVGPRAIRFAIKRGALPAQRVGGSWLVTREAVEHYRASRTT